MLNTGTRIGSYEVTSQLGAGGMGEVYRARDTKLGRDVAIKVLPEAFTHDSDRMARFSREAKLLAALNHPNIAAIHGLEDSGATHALVMELAEGPTLADRIKQGPIPIEEALPIAKQIADALEYAHEHGIIHRDLKPANIKVAADDTVKILDFGLAKAMETELSAAELANSPTVSRLATQAGVLLGTAAYMSPEQAKGKSVDRRADIWAFGCVLYEMLTGKMAFHGDTVTDTLASIIKEEPDWSQLPAVTPMRVRILLRRCLEKDVRQRLQAMGEARISLEEVLSGAPEGTPTLAAFGVGPKRWLLAVCGLAGVAILAAALFAFLYFHHKPPASQAVRFQIPFPQGLTSPFTNAFALSPDGRQLAFAAVGSDGVEHIWLRALNALEARPLPGSESPLHPPFFWSPDSRYIAFDAGGKLKKIPVSGGPAETICDLNGNAPGGSWSRDGVIIFGNAVGGLMRVSSGGGTASPLTTLDPSRSEDAHLFPSFVPDGRHFIYLRRSSTPEKSGIYVGSLDAKPDDQNSKLLLTSEDGALYVASADDPSVGQLLFYRDGALLGQPFDARRWELAGDAVTLAEGLGESANFAYFSISTNGALVYRAGNGGAQQLTWYDGQGNVVGRAGEPAGLVISARLSPDGKHAAVSRVDFPHSNGALWLLDLARGTSTRFTFGPLTVTSAVWSPDGNRIIFSSGQEGHFDLYQKPASGTTDEELLLKSGEDKMPSSWSRDGRFLLYTVSDPKTKNDLWVLPLEGDKKPFPFLRTEFNERDGEFSPEGRWIAYTSDESGSTEVYVRPFFLNAGGSASSLGAKWLISNGGGSNPRWRGDGKELYYIAPDGRLMAVEITTSPTFKAGIPKALFQAPSTSRFTVSQWDLTQWDLTADGKRFLFTAPAAQSTQPPFTVVLNWQAALKK